MSEKIFREKSLERIQSPECLNDTIRVVNPGIWMLLVSMILLLAGALCWAVFGAVDITSVTPCTVTDGVLICPLTAADCDTVLPGMPMTIEGNGQPPLRLTVPENALIEDPEGKHFALARMNVDLPDGSYTLRVVTETIRPLSFLLN